MAEKVEIIVTATDRASGSLKSLSKNLKDIGGQLTSIGTTMSAAVTAPVVAGFGLAVKNASDLEETLNKVRVVFGDAADEVLRFSENAAVGMGMSRQQAADAAGTFGNLFTSMGIGVDTSAEMSTSLLTLAADLASFNNIDPAIALEKLRAGLVGEIEPLRTLGVNLSAATVEAKALEMGLVAEGEELSAAAKAQAAYALILEQTTNAQGDFARTSDGLANSTRILKAQLADVAAELGQQLLPIALQLALALRDLLDRFSAMTPEMQQTALVVAGVVAAIGPLLVIVGQLVTAVGALTPVLSAVGAFMAGPLLVPIAGLVAAIGMVVLWWKTAIESFQRGWEFMQTYLMPIFNAFGQLLTAVVGLAVRVVAGYLQTYLLPGFQTIANYLSQVLGPTFTAISDFLSTTFAPVIQAVTGFIDRLKTSFGGLQGAIQGVATWISNLATKINSLSLPDWLTPGSPTPFEIGLRGINKELADLSTANLPNLSQSLNVKQPERGVLGMAAQNDRQTQQVSNNYNLTINEAGGRGNVVSDFALLKALAGA